MTKYEYKCVRIKKNGICKLIMNVCKKNVALPREWAGNVDQTVESLYFLNIFSHRSSLKFLICLTLATVLQYFYINKFVCCHKPTHVNIFKFSLL